jgi:PPOX class probable F420-dependent enzyme
MDVAAALAYLRSNHRGVIATTRADGTTQMSPITVGVDAADRVVA